MVIAARAFARFVTTEAAADAAVFGLFSAAAILTKGTGWALALLPVLVILFRRDWRLIRARNLWLSAVIVGVAAMPWQLMTTKYATDGLQHGGWQFIRGAAPDGLKLLFVTSGIPIALLALFAVADEFFTERRPDAWISALIALVLADWLIHVVIPAGLENRRMIPGIPAMFVLAGFGAVRLAARLFPKKAAGVAASVILVSSSAVAAVELSSQRWLEGVANDLHVRRQTICCDCRRVKHHFAWSAMRRFIPAVIFVQLAAAEFPQAEISNARIHAKLYLPNPETCGERADNPR